MLIQLFCITLLFTITLTQNFQLIKHIDSPAKCLDGSPAALYIQPAPNSDKFVIYFEGGGLCRGDGLSNMI